MRLHPVDLEWASEHPFGTAFVTAVALVAREPQNAEPLTSQVLWLLMAPPQNLSHHERDGNLT